MTSQRADCLSVDARCKAEQTDPSIDEQHRQKRATNDLLTVYLQNHLGWFNIRQCVSRAAGSQTALVWFDSAATTVWQSAGKPQTKSLGPEPGHPSCEGIKSVCRGKGKRTLGTLQMFVMEMDFSFSKACEVLAGTLLPHRKATRWSRVKDQARCPAGKLNYCDCLVFCN